MKSFKKNTFFVVLHFSREVLIGLSLRFLEKSNVPIIYSNCSAKKTGKNVKQSIYQIINTLEL